MLRWGDCYGSFLHKPHRACQSPSPGDPTVRGTVGDQINFTLALKVGRPQGGSDEGVPGGFHGAGNRPTGPRWQRDSSTRRHYHIAPSSVSCADSFPPKGKPTLLGYVGIFATVVFYSEPYRICQRLPLGGKVGRPFGPGRMRADVKGSAAWVIDAPPLPWTSFDFTSLLYKNLPVSPY